MCGDATKPEHVERLLDGAKPDLMVTDPPYGVNYDASWRDGLGYAAGRARGASTNDDRCDWQAAYAIFPGSIAYVWMGSGTRRLSGLFLADGGEVSSTIYHRKPE